MKRWTTTRALRFTVLCLVLFLEAAGHSLRAEQRVFYTCDMSKQEEHFFHIEIRTEVEKAATFDFQMPAWNALYQIRDFAHRVRAVEAFNQDHMPLPVEKVDKQTWRVAAQDAREVVLDYEVYANVLTPYDAQLDAHHGFFNGAYIFMYLVGGKNLPIQVRFRIPESWHIATELIPTQEKNVFNARNYDHLVDSPVEAGTFRWLQFESKGAKFNVIVDGETAQIDDRELLLLLKRIVEAEFETMQDVPLNHYTFIYHFPEGPSGGGMEHAFSTAINMSAQEVSRRLDEVANVSAHEFFHLWNVKRIRPASLEPIDYARENYTRALWFSEGVTSLYGAYTLVRAGVDKKEDFYRSLAETIQSEQERPARLHQSVEEASLDTWLDKYPFYRRPENSISYYEKGEILGLLLDLTIRQGTNNHRSLDDVMRFLNKEYAQRGRFFDDRAGIPDAVERVTGKPLDEFFARYVHGIEEIDYNSFLRAAGLKLDLQPRKVGDPGFTVTQNFDGAPRIDEVTAGSPAEKAGLKNGDVLVEINGRAVTRRALTLLSTMDPGKRVKIKCVRSGQTLEVSFQTMAKTVTHYAIMESADPTPLQISIRDGILTGR
ncbi:MAG: PDZ domain-containing protein [Acidobacteriia bacterium]|nr:PDZ domain-containing protein [Terriglobia bacterium]